MGNTTSCCKECCEKLFRKKNNSYGADQTFKDSLTENLKNKISFNYEKEQIKHKISFDNSKSFCNYNTGISIQDFKIIKTLGKGSFGKVLLVNNINNKRNYAMKVLKKELLQQTNQVIHTKTEREILEKINHPFIVKLHYAFQSSDKLYLVTEYMQGGELFYHLRKEGYFSEDRTRIYVCEIILALEHLHKNKIIYRDLKPENILIGKDGHIKLTDFGLSKILTSINELSNTELKKEKDERTYTICGTPEYLAPEILLGKGYNKSVDWWSLGVVMYEMLAGYSPYHDNKQKLDLAVYLKPIEKHKNLSKSAFKLLQQLLQPDPDKRIGSSEKDADEIKCSNFFKGVKWDQILKKRVIPKFIPYIKNDDDISNFDKMFTEEDPNSLSTSDKIFTFFPSPSKKRQNECVFENFTYVSQEYLLDKSKTKV